MEQNWFSRNEQIEFLKKKGYELQESEIQVWSQWGNHDNQGEYIVVKHLHAVVPGEKPTEDNIWSKVFAKLLREWQKSQFLNS